MHACCDNRPTPRLLHAGNNHRPRRCPTHVRVLLRCVAAALCPHALPRRAHTTHTIHAHMLCWQPHVFECPKVTPTLLVKHARRHASACTARQPPSCVRQVCMRCTLTGWCGAVARTATRNGAATTRGRLQGATQAHATRQQRTPTGAPHPLGHHTRTERERETGCQCMRKRHKGASLERTPCP